MEALRDPRPDDKSRSEILREAAMCFMERGYSATSIDDVARRLGATKGRIYHHYPSKADLFADVFRTGMQFSFSSVEPLSKGPERAIERWKKMARAHATGMIRTRAFQRVVWEGVELHLKGATTPEQRDSLGRLIAHRERYARLFRTTIEEARRDGDMQFSLTGIAEELMFSALNSPVFWYSPRAGETDSDIKELVDQIVSFALRGLGGKEGSKNE